MSSRLPDSPALKAKIHEGDILEAIGHTPLVEIPRMSPTPAVRIFAKLEMLNPGGSTKDRIGLPMIEAAERDGRLRPGGVIVEATAGNTGLGLALVGRIKGYRVVLVVPDKMATEKVLHLKALGAEIHITRSDVGKGHPEYYQDQAARLAARRRRPVPFGTPPDAADPADVVAGELALAQALGSLPVAQRAVVALRYVAGFSESDVAAFLSIPAGTVKSRLSRAAASLRGLADVGPTRSSEPPGGHPHA